MSISQVTIHSTTWEIRYSMTFGKFYGFNPKTGLRTGHFRTEKALKDHLFQNCPRRGVYAPISMQIQTKG